MLTRFFFIFYFCVVNVFAEDKTTIAKPRFTYSNGSSGAQGGTDFLSTRGSAGSNFLPGNKLEITNQITTKVSNEKSASFRKAYGDQSPTGSSDSFDEKYVLPGSKSKSSLDSWEHPLKSFDLVFGTGENWLTSLELEKHSTNLNYGVHFDLQRREGVVIPGVFSTTSNSDLEKIDLNFELGVKFQNTKWGLVGDYNLKNEGLFKLVPAFPAAKNANRLVTFKPFFETSFGAWSFKLVSENTYASGKILDSLSNLEMFRTKNAASLKWLLDEEHWGEFGLTYDFINPAENAQRVERHRFLAEAHWYALWFKDFYFHTGLLARLNFSGKTGTNFALFPQVDMQWRSFTPLTLVAGIRGVEKDLSVRERLHEELFVANSFPLNFDERFEFYAGGKIKLEEVIDAEAKLFLNRSTHLLEERLDELGLKRLSDQADLFWPGFLIRGRLNVNELFYFVFDLNAQFPPRPISFLPVWSVSYGPKVNIKPIFLTLGIAVNQQWSRTALYANGSAVVLPDLHRLDMSFEEKIGSFLTLQLRIENLLDADEVLLPGTKQNGRSFLAGFLTEF
jgi:hypothetical protein